MVLTDAGDKAFSAGLDLKAIAGGGLSRQMVKRSPDITEDEAFDLQGAVLIEVFSPPDAREGPRLRREA